MADDDSWAAIGKSASDGPKCDDDEDICAAAERLVFFFFQRVYIISGIQEVESVREIQTC